MKITGGPTPGSGRQPTSPPSPLENISLHYSYYLFPSFSPRPHTLDGVGGYEMACGHCRRPRKEILAFNFDQLCWVRGLSNSPKSLSGSKVLLRGSKMAPEIGSWEPQNSPSRPEAHPGRCPGTPPSASRLRWRGYLKIKRFSHGQIQNYRWPNCHICMPAHLPPFSS